MNGPNWLQFKLIQGFMHVVVTRKFDEDPSKSIGNISAKTVSKESSSIYPNSNPVEILCLSRLSAFHIKIRLKRNSLSSGHGKNAFSALKSKKLRRKLTDLDRIWHCQRFILPVLVTSTFDTDTIKSKGISSIPFIISLCCLAYQILKISYTLTWNRIQESFMTKRKEN